MSLRLLEPCRFEETVKRSRFLAHAAPVATEADTLAFFDAVADPGASHNCWAWRLDGRHRSSDDGEPGGTAGRPILAVLEGRDLDGVMVVVTRYYGGINLGVGGLVRAYGGAAAKCLDRGQTERRERRLRCELVADFDQAGTVHLLLERHGARKHGERYGEKGLVLDIDVPQQAVEALRTELGNASRGAAKLWISR